MNEVLTVDPVFEKIIPELSEDEFAQLEENILTEGMIMSPIVVWNGVIIDGHNRYKIAQKHPEIPFTIRKKFFENHYEAIAWICSHQLGRRNINKHHKKYLLGKRYDAEKAIAKFHGNQHTLADESGLVQNEPDHHNDNDHDHDHGTRTKVAKDANVSESFVMRADWFAKGVDAADEVCPGIKRDILSGVIEPPAQEIEAIAKLPSEKRQEATERLRLSKNERKAQAVARQIEEEFEAESERSDKMAVPSENEDNRGREHEIEESILNSMIGEVNMFIDSINNYLSRFPKLRTEPKYRSQVREIMMAAKEYIHDVEGDFT